MYYKTKDPFRNFEELANKMSYFGNKVLRDLEHGVTVETNAQFNPRIEIIEEADQYLVYAELPGVSKENVGIQVNEEGKLSIKGKKDKDQHKEGTVYHRNERVFGEFERKLLLPELADFEKVAAKYENGVLEISIAKKEPVKPKEVKIDIK